MNQCRGDYIYSTNSVYLMARGVQGRCIAVETVNLSTVLDRADPGPGPEPGNHLTSCPPAEVALMGWVRLSGASCPGRAGTGSWFQWATFRLWESEDSALLSSTHRSYQKPSHGGTPQVGATVAQKGLSQPPRLKEAPPAGTGPGTDLGFSPGF